MIQVIYGKELYLIDRFLADAKKGRTSIIEKDVIDEDIAIEISTPSFFDRKLIIIKVNSIEEVSAPFIELIKSEPAEADVILIVRNMDNNSPTYKKLEKLDQKSKFLKEFKKLNEKELITYINSLFQEKKKTLPAEFLPILLKRLNYESECCNLYEVNLIIEKIVAISVNETISQAEIENASEDNSEGNVFQIFNLLIKGNMHELMREIYLIPDNSTDVLKVLGLLLSKFRIAYKAGFYPNKNIAAKELYVAAWKIQLIEKEAAVISECMDIIVEGMSDIKSGILKNETAIKHIVLRLFHKLHS